MADQTRTYRMKRRAESQEETRRRITASAAELHETLGPSRTSLSAVAERAGVRRSTLYRHFPDEAALMDACTAHWVADNPPPDPASWSALEDAGERLRAALADLYRYYESTESMLANLTRDAETNPLVAERFGAFSEYFVGVREGLLGGRKLRGAAKRRARAAIGHAVAFTTWRSLAREQGLERDEAVALMGALVEAAEAPRR